MPKQVFDVGQLLSDEGLKLERGLGDGQFQVRTTSGETRTFDVAAYAKDNGLDPSKLEFSANDPKTAVNISPVGIVDRAALSLGNAAGKMSYLKNKFDAVKYDADKGIVVNNKGVWQQVDPSGLGGGDAWEMTKELVKDAVDLSDFAGSAIGSTLGAAGGAALGALGGPVGIAAGGATGAGVGGGIAEGLRTSLGRLAGTYEATPEEQLKDIGLEALLNMGGETIGLGVKATFGKLGKAFSNLSANASDGSKDIIAQSVGKISGAGEQATRTVLDQPAAVMQELAQAKIGSRNTSQIVDKLRDQQVAAAQHILEQAPKDLTNQFGKLKGELVAASKEMPEVNIGELATKSLQSIEDAGLLVRTQKKNGGTVFKVMDTDTAIKLKNQGKNAAILAPNAQADLQPIVDQLNKFTKLGSFKGSEAAGTLMDLKKIINDIYRDSVSPSTPASVKSLLDKFRKDFSTNIGATFDKAGLTPQYMSTINLYEKFADSVAIARKMAQQDNGAELFVRKMVSDSGANRSLKGVTADLAQLMGQEGSDMINSITTKEAAKAFSPILPRAGLMSNLGVTAAAGIGAYSASTGNTPGLGTAAALGVASSPRAALNGIIYGQKALGLLQSLVPSQLKQMLGDEKLLGTFLRTTFTAPLQQEATTKSLVEQAKQAAGQAVQAGRPQQPEGK